jgi:signal transduction histidine kinase
VAASKALADSAAIPTLVTADSTDHRYAAGIETAAYFVIAEALTNAVKHSRASAISIAIREESGRLRIEVRDNGVGGANTGRGSGIIGLQDRVAAVGGQLTFDSPAEGGTVITAELPCR